MTDKNFPQEDINHEYAPQVVNYGPGPQVMPTQQNYLPGGNMPYSGPQAYTPKNMGKTTQYGQYNYPTYGPGYQQPQYSNANNQQGMYNQMHGHGSYMHNHLNGYSPHNHMPGYGPYAPQMHGHDMHHHMYGAGPYMHHPHHPHMIGQHGYNPYMNANYGAYGNYGGPGNYGDMDGHWLSWLHPGFFRSIIRSPRANNFFRGVGVATVGLLLAPSIARILRPVAVSVVNGVNDIAQEVKGVVDEAREDMQDVFAETNWDGFKLDDEKAKS